ncbi:MAG: NAD-dependent epimerase/dehydratase family protein [Dehalococcoidia bacterium]
MKRVLVTGATGFVGRHCLSALLERGYEVHAVTSQTPTVQTGDVRWRQADLLDPLIVGELTRDVRATHLLHCAWYAEPGSYWTSLENVRWVQASLELFQGFSRHGGQRVLVAGSCAEYDWAYGYCSESVTPCSPRTLYGVSKHALHLLLDAFATQVGLDVAWGRLFFLFGPHESPQRLVASVIQALLRGEPALCSHGGQIRDFLCVTEAAQALVAVLDSDVGGAVNIGSGCPVSVRDVVTTIARIVDRENLVRFGALPTPAEEPPLLVADVRRLHSLVGWQPRCGLEDALRTTIDWWTAHSGAIHSPISGELVR